MKVTLTLRGNRIYLDFRYAEHIVERLRAIPGRHFDSTTKRWDIPAARDTLLMICDVAGILPSMLEGDLRAIVGPYHVVEQRVDMSLIDGHEFLVPPFEHQRVNLARLMAHPRWLLCDECGTGKTFNIVNRLMQLLHHDGVHLKRLPVLILCPKTVCHVWQRQLFLYGGLPSVVVEGDKRERQEALQLPGIKIANYEQLLHTDFSAHRWEVIVFDEIHRLKSFTGSTARIARLLSSQADYVWGLTGTPAPNGLEDWLGTLAAVDPNGVPWRTKRDFESQHVYKTMLNNIPVISGYRNVMDLHAVICRYVSRVTKAEALDLPEKVFSERYVALSGEQARIYREMRRDAVARLVSMRGEGTLTANNVLTESLRLLQIVGGFVPDDEGVLHELPHKAKITALADALDEIGDKQVVLWCCFREEANFLQKWLFERYGGPGIGILTGAVGSDARQRSIEWFRRGDYRFFVGTAAAGGTGVDGLQVASDAIYYSRSYNLVDYLQSQDRTHRIGSRSQVTIHKLLAENTLDTKVDACLEEKRSLQEMMLGRPLEEIL